MAATRQQNRCESGYTKGWDSTCALALKDPHAEHDIYGCPGISDKENNNVLVHEPKLKETPEEKADCAAMQKALVNQHLASPNQVVPCI